jgi:hypothetical protein
MTSRSKEVRLPSLLYTPWDLDGYLGSCAKELLRHTFCFGRLPTAPFYTLTVV